jgi:hypothetical protein
MHKQLTVVACLALLTHCAPAADVPAWVAKAIADQEASGARSLMISECTYDGQTVYRVTHLDVVEASEADALFVAGGQRLCRFTDFAPPGETACDAAKLACHRTLHPAK